MYLTLEQQNALKLIYERADFGRPVTEADVKEIILASLVKYKLIEKHADGSYWVTTAGNLRYHQIMCFPSPTNDSTKDSDENSQFVDNAFS